MGPEGHANDDKSKERMNDLRTYNAVPKMRNQRKKE